MYLVFKYIFKTYLFKLSTFNLVDLLHKTAKHIKYKKILKILEIMNLFKEVF